METKQKSTAKVALPAALSGLAAFIIITGGAAMSAWYYSGRTQERYSFFNHFVSELGNKNYSGHAYFFNDAMMLSGIPIIIFIMGVSRLLSSRFRYGFLVSGILSGVLCCLLGYFSSDRFYIHIRVALGQFNMMLLSSIFFSLAVLRERQSHFHRWLAYYGAFPILCISLFLCTEYRRQADVKNGHTHYLLYHRPDFWLLPFVEWLVFFSLLGWFALICIYLIFSGKSK